MSASLESFLREKRGAMVTYAFQVMVDVGLHPDRARALAEDVVQAACLGWLEKGEAWCEPRFVGNVRNKALRAWQAEMTVHDVRNRAEEGGQRGTQGRMKKRRSRVTDMFPTQVFGVGLADAFDAAPDQDGRKKAA